MEFTIAIITSSIAIVVAIISGLFSYFSTKRSAKVTAMQTYLAFLEHKMNKLEEALKSYNSIEDKFIDSIKGKDNDIVYNSIRIKEIFYDHSASLLSIYSYLLKHNDVDFKRLLDLKTKISTTMDYNNLKKTHPNITIKKEYKDELLEPYDYDKTLRIFNDDVKALIEKELTATYKKLEDLSLLK